MKLSKKISENQSLIKKYLHCGFVNWDSLIERISKQEYSPHYDFSDEQVWTFLAACGYAIAGEVGLKKLSFLFTAKPNLSTEKIWFEVLPSATRCNEGATHLDLAIGDIKLRKGTKSGIELNSKVNSWIAFCEMKWYSDISLSVSNCQHRNQLARVIENALFFKENNKYANEVYVNLVTPKVFTNPRIKSRLYSYKFVEYKKSLDALWSDIQSCGLKFRQTMMKDSFEERIGALNLNWITFDLLFESMPKSEIADEILHFVRKYNKTE